ncbi:hypothetical protein CW749_02070 [Vibrio sp. vnigr-6D03]|uniref:hypothetical protein n=1 Tax=Vibrio sp. vnigr-6D03 TaxID=2058088 RepID=UPI000C346105|nr:hypothetical protein [Vibrio sp. vnigr-6D03]PKF81448.1 hypothetical protein CW749_02070 [Vibrio sp. vnigr-6D03]
MHSTHRFKLILGMGTLLASSVAHAIPSNTVGTFGVNGKLSANYADYTGSNSRTYFKDIESTPDGSLLAAGYASRADGIYDVLLVKQSQTGALDTSFDSDGKLVQPQIHSLSSSTIKVILPFQTKPLLSIMW